MNWSTIEAKWNDYKGEAQKQWSKLADEQINGTMGSRSQLSARLQQACAVRGRSESPDQRMAEEQMEQPRARRSIELARCTA